MVVDALRASAFPAQSFDLPGIWNSQCGQEMFVQAALAWPADVGNRPEGYFVDLAANHAVFLSNTRTLERDAGWRGLCIEGNPTLVHELRLHRECDVMEAVVIKGSAREVNFLVGAPGEQDGYSRIAAPGERVPEVGRGKSKRSKYQTIVAQGLSLESMLEQAGAPRVIDYLSLDVEGHEEEVRTLQCAQSHVPFAKPSCRKSSYAHGAPVCCFPYCPHPRSTPARRIRVGTRQIAP